MATFTREQVLTLLQECGVKSGDTLLVHSALLSFGLPSDHTQQHKLSLK